MEEMKRDYVVVVRNGDTDGDVEISEENGSLLAKFGHNLEDAKIFADKTGNAVYDRLEFDGKMEICDLVYPRAPEPAFGYDLLVAINHILINRLPAALEASTK